MSTIDRPEPRILPPLVAGQRLDQPTFHARYEAMPAGIRAELVGGIVRMPSPLSREHGEMGHRISGWLYHYGARTPGVRGADNATAKLDPEGETRSDSLLRILPEFGGATRDVEGYIAGAPELIVEVALSSRVYDLNDKYADYERAGVAEYLVIALDPDEVFWHVRLGDRFVRITADPDGLYRSRVFPGLWLDPASLFAQDDLRSLEVLDRGLATPEHAAFVARLAARRGG